MRILVIAPELSNLARGNHVTALRWGRIFDRLGHEVSFASDFHGQDCDALVALHAIRSAGAIAAFHASNPAAPIVVALTGTDIYGLDEQAAIGIDQRDAGWRSMDLAARIVVLQPRAAEEVPELVRDKVTVIFQSAEARPRTAAGGGRDERPSRHFDVVVVGELRAVKDPFRAALAARRLPSASRVRLRHIGPASSQEMAERAVTEERSNSRYTWLGELSRDETMGMIAASHLVVVSSRHEGGPNVLSEALAAGLPALATRIPGNEGILGSEYPGYFSVEDTEALADLLQRAEEDIRFYDDLREHVAGRAEIVDPERELRAWEDLLAGLDVDAPREPGAAETDDA